MFTCWLNTTHDTFHFQKKKKIRLEIQTNPNKMRWPQQWGFTYQSLTMVNLSIGADIFIALSTQAMLIICHRLELIAEALFMEDPMSINCCWPRALVYTYHIGYQFSALLLIPLAHYVSNSRMRKSVFENFSIYLPEILFRKKLHC